MQALHDYHGCRAEGHRAADLAFAVIVNRLIDNLAAPQQLQMIRQQLQVVGLRVQRRNISLFSSLSVQAVIVVHGEGADHLLAQYPLYAARDGGLP